MAFQEGFSSDEGESGSSQGCLFEYLERAPPYSREPLANKVSPFINISFDYILFGDDLFREDATILCRYLSLLSVSHY